MHMYAYCIHIDENCIEMLKKCCKVVKFNVFDTLCDGLILFQTTSLVFVTFYRSRHILRSVVHRETLVCIDFVLILVRFLVVFWGKNCSQRIQFADS